jgi:enoyl-[acyl-carrier protein] reductase III
MFLKDKIALVTGGSRGIGKAIALKLADQGANVIINFVRHKEAAKQTAVEVEAKGVKSHIIRAHIGEPENINRMFEDISQNFGKLDILINNAASGIPHSALELDVKGWEWAMNINARAILLCTQKAVPLMEDRGGKVVNISSLGSTFVWPNYVSVGVSKAAVDALTKYLAVELIDKNICVNGVSASAVLTEALMHYIPENEDLKPAWQATPAGRMVEPADVANVVAFLCSEQAFMIRGQTIIVDGGISVTPYWQMTENL